MAVTVERLEKIRNLTNKLSESKLGGPIEQTVEF